MSEKEFKAKFTADNSDLKKKTKEVESLSSKFAGKLKMLGAALGGFFAVGKIVDGFKALISINAKFEKSLASLSAITGATGDDLKFYGKAARDIGKQTTISADEVVEAFKLMGSARPELLKNKEALASVTKEAIVLSEASGLDLTTATMSLAKAMNQFNVPAGEAARVINALAAGSKEGAMEVPDVAEAIKNMGTVAYMANISLEQSVSMIETLAEKGMDGSKAGIMLRNVIIKLQSGVDKFNPKVVGMSKALENLGAANLSAADLTQMFGLENQIAASILINNRQRVDELTTAVTGTNTAYEQQAIMLDTLDAKWKIFKSTIGDVAYEVGGFVDKLKGVLTGTTELVKGFDTLNDDETLNWFQKLAIKIGVLSGNTNALIKMTGLMVEEDKKAALAKEELTKASEAEAAALKAELEAKARAEAAAALAYENRKLEVKTVTEVQKEIELLTTTLNALSSTHWAEAGAIRNKIAEYQKYIDALTKTEKIQRSSVKSIQKLYGKGFTKGLQLLPGAEMIDPMKVAHTYISTVVDDLTNAEKAAQAFGDQIMAAGIQGTQSMKDFGRVAVEVAERVIAAYVAEAVAGAVKSALVGVPFPFNIMAAGVAGGLAAAAINAAIPNFAAGGGVSGPTMAMVGEAPGISRSNPEYIGTAKQLSQMGVGKGGVLTTRVSRGDLLFILNEGGKYNTSNY